MINSLEGKLTGLTLNEAYISTGSGIEFRLMVSSQTASAIMSYLQKDENIKLYTILIHREDAMQLIGFKDRTEREVFEELTSISGIGTKQALKILSGFSTREFIEALDKGDVKKLSSIPGLGIKTAQKILIMLREKLVEIEEDAPKNSKISDPKLMPYVDIINSVCDMGYQKEDVKQKLLDILEEERGNLRNLSEGDREKQLFRLLISGLSNG